MSTIVSTLLLVVATGIIGAFLVAWANSSFAFQTLNISTESADHINLIKESYVIEDVWFYDSGSSANVTIRNTGDLAVTISRIYVNSSQVFSPGQSITTGSYATITLTPLNPAAGLDHVQSIIVITERGTQAKQDWKY